MGSGSSSLTTEQKAHIAKLMKEKYEKLTTTTPNLTEEEKQKDMEKYYNELLLSLKPPASLDSLRKEQTKKKQPTRRRSYGDDKLKSKRDLPPRPQGKNSNNTNGSGTSPSNTNSSNVVIESSGHQQNQDNSNHHHHSNSNNNNNPNSESDPHDENVDSWESVRAQPSCLLCKMVFATESKYETHIKYSEVHAKNLARQNNKNNDDTGSHSSAAAAVLTVTQPTSLPPGPRCREIYTGSKFFWRYKQTVEVNIYLHLTSTPRCVEVCCYNNNHSYEYPRIYLHEEKIYQYVGDKYIKEKIEEMKDNIPAQEPLPADEILEDEVKRVVISSHVMNKLQLLKDDQVDSNETNSTSNNTNNASNNTSTTLGIKEHEKMFYVFTTSLTNPSAESPLLSSTTLPENLIPVMITRRRLSTSKEIESAFENFNNLGAQLLHSTEKAEQIINKITEENTNLFKQSNEIMIRANSRDGPRSARSQVGE